MQLTKPYKRLDKSDIELYKAFKSVVKQGKFEVQGEALMQVGALFRWFDDLDKRIEETLKPLPPIPSEVKEVEPPIKKLKASK